PAFLLAPLGFLYAAGGRYIRSRATPFRASVPVICVGNLVAGGAGKTPVVQALVGELQSMGLNPHVLLRGYGGRETGPLRVHPLRHTFQDVGDEALLHAALAPAWVARDRAKGAQAAIEAGADIVVMDDGFQNSDLYQDLPLIVIDGETGLGNGRVIPAGPLRESLQDGLSRAKAILLIGEDKTGIQSRLGTLPVFKARIVAVPKASLKNIRLLAFAGIGRPQKFFDTLTGMGAELTATRSFPDHHPYSASEIEALLTEAVQQNAKPITTAKDHVRIPPAFKDKVDVLPVSLSWESRNGAATLVEMALSSFRSRAA
ncbi:MAG: tetraacyldisaccharide 4'-kinase, partial [Rhodospirillales bacterium]